MSTSFDTSALVRAEKLTAAEKTTVANIIDSIKHLNKLIEDERPANGDTPRKAKDAAGEVMTANPTPATIAAYKAALGDYLNPEAVWRPVHDTLNALIDVELKKLVPIAKRIHSATQSAIRDPKNFGIESVDSLPDIAERGEALTAFAAKHTATLEEHNRQADYFDNERSAYAWLCDHGYCERIWG
jgi:hypothetical protein